ncbi:MAG: FxLYD domain-containing protein [Thermoanaerobaculia bacterium]
MNTRHTTYPTRARLFRIGLTLGLLIAVTGLPAAADWLVTQDGDQVETRGAWEIKGKLVVFTLPNGTLSSMRLTDVDLDASQQRTHAQDVPSAPVVTTSQRREATIVITDSDVSHVGPEAPTSATERQEAGAEARAELAAEASGGELTVADWNQEYDDGIDGVVVTGNIENRSSNLHSEITLQVILYNTDGSLAGRAAATVDNVLLRAGQSSSFRAAFAGIVGFDRPEFRVNSTALSPRQEGAEGAEEAAEGEILAAEEGDDDDDE